MSEHPIEGLMKTAMENLKQMIDVNTIIGDPVETPDGSVILTVSKVGFGFAAGGSEFGGGEQQNGSSQQNPLDSEELPFGGGSGGGVSITPIAFLIVGSNGIKTIHLDNSTHLYERLLDLAPSVVEKIQQMMNNKNRQRNVQHQNNPNQPQNPF
ncbi:GerW family sporulation protein [Fictibacillus enclensis]|uniref:GerW family sporulation protein n=1 Tax=Fictibacillus enclensis TaxID=1017270 RepID=UPI0025A12582|nr:GerW family sporulation protein [Fictibacillus enclensis]MDM5339395.1 GerW family sporulation protein [Fictibacillus enclensis]